MLRNFGRLAPAQKRRAVLLCAVPVLGLAAAGAAVAATLFAVRPPAPEQAAVEPQKTYEQRQYEQEVAEFSGAFLRETEDAGEEYLQESLFVGDSNTVRLAAFGEIEMNSMAGVVGMGVQSVPTKACIWFREYAEPVTMARAAALLQPRRMIVMFGTNNTDMQPEAFIAAYEQALEALENGYPYADIILAAVPPVGAGKSGRRKGTKADRRFQPGAGGLCRGERLPLSQQRGGAQGLGRLYESRLCGGRRHAFYRQGRGRFCPVCAHAQL